MAHTTTPEAIGANVRAEMARRRVDQAQVAAVIGRSRPAVSDRLAGKTHFRVDELQKIAGFLKVPFEDLVAPAVTAASP